MFDRKDIDSEFLQTCFDRQIRIENWDQKKLNSQSILILGMGGLGSVILVALLRLGITKFYIVDNDVVDLHNLNRQFIFSSADIGKSKVQCAKKNSQFHFLSQNTQIITLDGDALKNWDKIIQFTKNSDIVFNCIDYGDSFDLAISSLCIKMNKPLISGGTFSTSITVEYFTPIGRACYLCSSDQAESNKEICQKLIPDSILNYTDISFLPKNNNPIGRSSTIACTICGNYMVSHMLNFLFLFQGTTIYPSSRMILYHSTYEIYNFILQRKYKCCFCGDPNQIEPQPVKQNVTKTEELIDLTDMI